MARQKKSFGKFKSVSKSKSATTQYIDVVTNTLSTIITYTVHTRGDIINSRTFQGLIGECFRTFLCAVKLRNNNIIKFYKKKIDNY